MLHKRVNELNGTKYAGGISDPSVKYSQSSIQLVVMARLWDTHTDPISSTVFKDLAWVAWKLLARFPIFPSGVTEGLPIHPCPDAQVVDLPE